MGLGLRVPPGLLAPLPAGLTGPPGLPVRTAPSARQAGSGPIRRYHCVSVDGSTTS